jgi:hypothetical protein
MLALLAVPAYGQQERDLEVITQFNDRVEAYVAIQRRLSRESAGLSTALESRSGRRDPANVRASQQQLASRLRAVRHGSQQGDVLTDPVAAMIRARLIETVPGAQADAATATARAPELPLILNGVAPDNASTPAALAVLPQLPPELQFRIIGNVLILHDVDANTVVDYITDLR